MWGKQNVVSILSWYYSNIGLFRLHFVGNAQCILRSEKQKNVLKFRIPPVSEFALHSPIWTDWNYASFTSSDANLRSKKKLFTSLNSWCRITPALAETLALTTEHGSSLVPAVMSHDAYWKSLTVGLLQTSLNVRQFNGLWKNTFS